ncbi:MAG TPA: acyl-CoA dehydrogenase family protein [Alphaproteobacteria bacterium]|nr:acyl-CoA dehydrogenase family protein [Alphaproteobacteria bacterium]
MLNFSLSPEQEALRDGLRSFLRKECPPEYVRACDEEARFPEELFRKLADQGWLGLPIPEAYGGTGASCMDLIVFLEEFAHTFEAGANIFYTTIVIGADMLTHFGSEEQKRKLLPRLAKGEIRFAFSVSEPDSGSDAAALRTRAQLDGDHWIVNGQKMFCSCAQEADYILLLARTAPDAPKQEGITMFLIDPRTPGVELRKIKKLGLKPMDINEIFLTDVRVPRDDVVGGVNKGWTNVLKSFDYERCCLSAVNVGASQACFDLALAYAKQRKQFGRPISEFQPIKGKLVDMDMEISASRMLVHRSAWEVDRGTNNSRSSGLARLKSAETYMKAALEGMRIMAGWGFLMEFDMQRHYRDARLAEIAPTPEILRLVIGRELLR